jgi:hypothetical protein
MGARGRSPQAEALRDAMLVILAMLAILVVLPALLRLAAAAF